MTAVPPATKSESTTERNGTPLMQTSLIPRYDLQPTTAAGALRYPSKPKSALPKETSWTKARIVSRMSTSVVPRECNQPPSSCVPKMDLSVRVTCDKKPRERLKKGIQSHPT